MHVHLPILYLPASQLCSCLGIILALTYLHRPTAHFQSNRRAHLLAHYSG